MHADGSFNVRSSDLQGSRISQSSFYSEFGTALSITSEGASSINDTDTSARSSMFLAGPPRQYTIYDLKHHLDDLLTPAEQDRFTAQLERFRPRRLFRQSLSSNVSSGGDSVAQSSFGSCNVRVPSSQNSFVEDVGDSERRRCTFLTIPEVQYVALPLDGSPRRSVGAEMEDRDQSGDCSFATFGLDCEVDERVMCDTPSSAYTSGHHGAKDVEFTSDGPSTVANIRAARGSDHRRDSVLVNEQKSSESTSEVKASNTPF
eukprot:TRINITY_DN3155_c0_g2_i1.p1 TRINITY_DN3155_c0_g2~~TRINITY_DN3155_c0_g2_i1.p1  ORF type:complete len:260 (-),score=31.41 TRINITY_DN3155_c0_g2_i1:171-950(-)